MKLNDFDNKLVQITDYNNEKYEGYAIYNCKEYNEIELGTNEDSLQIVNVVFYKSNIKDICVIEEFTNDYSSLEKTIVEGGIELIEDALEDEDNVSIIRLLKYINDNMDIINDRLEEALNNLVKYNNNEEITLLVNSILKKD